MRVSGKKQDISKLNNGRLCPTDFQRKIVSTYQNCEKILDRKKDNNSTRFTFSVLLAKYKGEEIEIRHVPYCYKKKQIHSLTSTQLVLFDRVHVKQVSRPPTKIRLNDYNF